MKEWELDMKWGPTEVRAITAYNQADVAATVRVALLGRYNGVISCPGEPVLKLKKGDRVALTDGFRYHRHRPEAPRGSKGTVVGLTDGVYVLLDIDHPWRSTGKKIPKSRLRKLGDLEILAEEAERILGRAP